MQAKRPYRLLAMTGMALALAACAPGELDEDGNPLPPGGTTTPPPPAPGTPVTPPPAGNDPAVDAKTCGIENFAATMLAQINALRAQSQVCGAQSMPAVAAVQWNSKLEVAAARHSQDMAANTNMDHTGSDGSTPFTRMQDAGYSFTYANENVAYGQSGIDEVLAAWMNSDGHCVNIMAAQSTHTAAACTIGSDGRKYWTLVGGSGQ